MPCTGKVVPAERDALALQVAPWYHLKHLSTLLVNPNLNGRTLCSLSCLFGGSLPRSYIRRHIEQRTFKGRNQGRRATRFYVLDRLTNPTKLLWNIITRSALAEEQKCWQRAIWFLPSCVTTCSYLHFQTTSSRYQGGWRNLFCLQRVWAFFQLIQQNIIDILKLSRSPLLFSTKDVVISLFSRFITIRCRKEDTSVGFSAMGFLIAERDVSLMEERLLMIDVLFLNKSPFQGWEKKCWRVPVWHRAWQPLLTHPVRSIWRQLNTLLHYRCWIFYFVLLIWFFYIYEIPK